MQPSAVITFLTSSRSKQNPALLVLPFQKLILDNWRHKKLSCREIPIKIREWYDKRLYMAMLQAEWLMYKGYTGKLWSLGPNRIIWNKYLVNYHTTKLLPSVKLQKALGQYLNGQNVRFLGKGQCVRLKA